MTAKEPLSVTHPKLAKQAVGWDPATITRGSDAKKTWGCELGHAWSASVSSRVAGSGCPFCSGRSVITGVNDLETNFPDVALEALGWDPTKVSSKSNTKRMWRCKLGHSWSAVVSNRTGGNGCPVCTGRKVLIGFNDLHTTHPVLAAQADGWDPKAVSQGSNGKRTWKCEKGHVWEAVVAKRVGGQNCPVCAGKKVVIGFNDLATTDPELAAQAQGWNPTTVTRGSDGKKGWKCSSGHLWESRVYTRSSGIGCPVCAGQQILVGFNDLQTTHPLLAVQADGWDPTTVSKGSNGRKNWLCSRGHRWKAPVADRSSGNGCPVCAGQQLLVGFNDLQTTHPVLAAQADGWDPTTVSKGSRSRRGWRCRLGHHWETSVDARGQGIGCPICSGRKILRGFNDLLVTDPELASQADGWDPTTLTRGSDIKKSWKCEQGHRWKAAVYSRSSGNGCPSCANYGFDPNEKAWLYFLSHPRWEMLQIGITNFPDDRLNSHRKIGWELIELRGPMDGLIAREWETSILRMLKRHGAKLASEEVAGKFDGYTEAWIETSFNATSIRDLIDAVEGDEYQSL